ncbi:MAG: pyridoxal phosphate-dependent aminotransferase [Chloroflexota bacterium]|jgi:aspartate aminotransferase
MIGVSKAVERLGGSQRNLADKLPTPKTSRVVGLHRGDPSFDTPEYVIQAAVRAMKEGYTHYPATQGDVQLREAVASYQSKISGVPVSASEVLITSGGTGAIFAAMMAYLNEGDDVIILDPTYSLYADVARVVGANIVSVPLTSTFDVDVDAVRDAVTERTKMMVLNFPSNPTGQLLEQAELDGLASIASERDLIVLADEVYDQLVFTGKHLSVLGHPLLTERTILANSFSKTYAMTGWRVGWIVAKGALLKPVSAMNRTAVGYQNNIAMRAALTALTDEEEDRKWRAWMLGRYQEQRQAMWDQLQQVPGVHVYDLEAAFYAWVRYDAPLSSVEMMKYLYERGLNVRPGTEFGAMGEKHLRFTFAPSVQDITDGVAIFKAAMQELRS